MKLTKKRFRELCADVGLMASEHQMDTLYLTIVAETQEKKTDANAQTFIAAYHTEYEARWGSKPHPLKREIGMAASLVKSLGHETAITLLGTYFGMGDSYFAQQSYSLGCFVANIQKIKTQHDTGRSFNRSQARGLERRAGNSEAFGRLLAKRGSDDK